MTQTVKTTLKVNEIQESFYTTKSEENVYKNMNFYPTYSPRGKSVFASSTNWHDILGARVKQHTSKSIKTFININILQHNSILQNLC